MKRLGIWTLILLLAGMLIIAGCAGQETTGQENHDHDHECELEGKPLPFEWSGEFTLGKGTYTLEFQESHDASCNVAFVLNEGNMDDIVHHAHHVMEAEKESVKPTGSFNAKADFAYVLTLNPEGTTFSFNIEDPADYVIFFEHLPQEFDLKVLDSHGHEIVAKNPVEHEGEHHHHHDHDD